jgi:hypothetical protein
MPEAWEAAESGAEVSKLSPPPELFTPPEERRGKRAVSIVLGIGLAFGAGTWAGYQRLWAPAAPPPPALRVVLHKGRLIAMWDAKSPPVSGADHARLEVRDLSGSRWQDLDGETLSRGSAFVESDGRELRVRLHGPRWTESARYAGPPPQVSKAVSENSRALTRHAELQRQLDEQLARNQELEERLESLRTELSERLRFKKSEEKGVKPAAAESNAPPAAGETARTEIQPVGPRFGEPLSGQSAPRAVAPAPAEVLASRPSGAYSGPRAGRIIWTGILKPKATLWIRGGRPTIGSVSGQLPGVPVSLRVMPATNGPDGLVVYTNNARHRSPAVTPPGAENSFQRMTFQHDPRRAQRAVLAVSPSSQTGWMDFSVRAASEAVTALVIEWEISN